MSGIAHKLEPPIKNCMKLVKLSIAELQVTSLLYYSNIYGLFSGYKLELKVHPSQT